MFCCDFGPSSHDYKYVPLQKMSSCPIASEYSSVDTTVHNSEESETYFSSLQSEWNFVSEMVSSWNLWSRKIYISTAPSETGN